MKNTLYKKICVGAATLAVVIAGTIGVQPRRVEAVITVQEVGTNLAQSIINTGSTVANTGISYSLQLKEFVLDTVPMMIAKQVIRQLTTSVVNWINSGFEGNPSFISNPGGFFLDIGDEILGDFIAGNDKLRYLCSNFDIDLRIALALQFRPYQKRVPACTLSKVINNTKNAVNSTVEGFTGGDFSQGGWPAFISLTTEPDNNVYGSYIRADFELTSSILMAQKQTRDEVSQGAGFLSWKKCTDAPVPGDAEFVGPVNDADAPVNVVGSDFEGPLPPNTIKRDKVCETQTPGSVISGQLENVLGSGVRQLELADEINEIVNALVAQLVMQVIGGSGLRSVSGSGTSDPSAYINQLQGDAAFSAEQVKTMKMRMLESIDKFISQAEQIVSAKKSTLQVVTTTKNLYDSARACYQAILSNPNTSTRGNNANYERAYVQLAEIDQTLSETIVPRLNSLSDGVTYGEKRASDLKQIRDTANTTNDPAKLTPIVDKYSEMVSGLANLVVDLNTAQTEHTNIATEMTPYNQDAQFRYQRCTQDSR